MKVRLSIVHINHGVRDIEADLDSKFVQELCQTLGLQFYMEKLENIEKTKASENFLREKRYKILTAQREKINAKFIVTAHHRDDLLETRVIRLLQGTGLHGLKAMEIFNSENVFRPLLGFTRREIETYGLQKKLYWRNDATNKDTAKLRNWVRRNWLSVLRREHPEYLDNFVESLERIASHESSGKVSSSQPKALRLARSADLPSEEVYNYLRHFSKQRVTSRHVAEFRKRLKTQRKKFTFRLAGVDWQVTDETIEAID